MGLSRRQYRDPRPGEIASFLSLHAKWVKPYGKELRFTPCPSCHHDKLQNPSTQINQDSGLWRCFRCHTTGNWFTLTRAFGSPLSEQERYKEDSFKVDPFHVKHFLKFAPFRTPVSSGKYPNLLEYTKGRGISRETLDAFKVSSCGDKILRWPIYAYLDGWKMVTARLRNIDDTATCRDWFEIKNGPTGLLIGNHLLNPNGPKRAVIFEGQWDVMSAYEIGMRNVFSLPNGASNIKVGEMLRYIPGDWDIWLAMDRDEAGERAVEKFFAQLGPDRVGRVVLPYKDLNEWLVAKPDLTEKDVEATFRGIYERKTTSQEYLDIDMDVEEREVISEVVARSPWKGLNDRIAGGFRAGQTTGILAPSGRGKTTIVNQIGVYAASVGVKVGIISLEGTRAAFKNKIRDCIRGQVDKKDYPKTIDHLLISPLEGSTVSFTDCLTEFESMINQGAKLLIIDNLDFICRDNMAEKPKAYAEIISMATRNDVHFLVVWQPNKIDRDATVNSGNQKGYSQTFQDSDNYINLNLIGDFNVLEVEKSRERGVDKNNKVYFLYNQDTRCFQETVEDISNKVSKAGNVILAKFSQG